MPRKGDRVEITGDETYCGKAGIYVGLTGRLPEYGRLARVRLSADYVALVRRENVRKVTKLYELVVGNLGTVHQGTDYVKARREYFIYVDVSLAGVGRGAHENVTLMRDGEPIMEHVSRAGLYELSADMPNGDTVWTREQCGSYHDAAVAGLDFAAKRGARLSRIKKITQPD